MVRSDDKADSTTTPDAPAPDATPPRMAGVRVSAPPVVPDVERGYTRIEWKPNVFKWQSLATGHTTDEERDMIAYVGALGDPQDADAVKGSPFA